MLNRTQREKKEKMNESTSLSPDLDSLLGDLERSIQERVTKKGVIPPEDYVVLTSETQNQEEYMSTTECGIPIEKMREHSYLNPSPSSPIHQNINELDILLNDLSNAKYNSTTSTSSQRKEVLEMKTTTRVQEIAEYSVIEKKKPEILSKDSVQRTPEKDALHRELALKNGSVIENGNQWGYLGYGVWENNKGASSATQELDHLMNSLNTFQIKDGPQPEMPVNTSLDVMLGDLRENLDRQGVRTTQKGSCFACQKPIIGQVITALGKMWHPEHFTCHHCNDELGTMNFFEREGKPYCEKDYHCLFSPKCKACGEAILDKCISALESTWHPEHFNCFSCKGPFGEDGFHEHEGTAYCRGCFFGNFAPKCGGCDGPILDQYISSLNAQWHRDCFVCAECQCSFSDGNYFEHGGKPYCETHYHALRGSLCAGCHKAIQGRCITAMFRKFHPEHFVCSFCLKQLNKGTFKEQGDKPYCHECYDRLFG
ncbi:PXN [Lepeophtheirus salmonis]|uniref:PXN n=1 Tax=Lepeophtheirus salmonis TaxID=72036 RepID=A0A7R8H5M7_LEPSM|nr:PXN [Lepeophtheirus salmonis]CAF2870212.1 PXN [Lepeophtheirus salmonis]